MTPLKPEHADKVVAVEGTDFSVKRVLVGYSYPRHGNLHNPTPNYRWLLMLDGKLVDADDSMRRLVAIARKPESADEYRK